MRWRKLGLLYSPRPLHPKLHSHAANPLAVAMDHDHYRVFYSARDIRNRSSVGCVDIDMRRLTVYRIHERPVFIHGAETSFHAGGVSIGNCYESSGSRYIPFMAWQTPPGEHWRGVIGRLILEADGSLVADGDEPLLALDQTDPISLSYPWVMRMPGGEYRMWYGSTVTWDGGNGEMIHLIKVASSTDGHEWTRLGQALPHDLGRAQAFSRPTVVGSPDEGYHMWFSYRGGCGQKYRIGYAFSRDGWKWELRLDDAGISVSTSGWDSDMIEYPFVFEHRGDRYMLYNGNGYGETGFGLAVLE